jgi:hypothetical protein
VTLWMDIPCWERTWRLSRRFSWSITTGAALSRWGIRGDATREGFNHLAVDDLINNR